MSSQPRIGPATTVPLDKAELGARFLALVKPARAERVRLPNTRAGYNQKFRIGGQTCYLRTGEYADGSLGEIFIDVNKTGAMVRALLNAVAMSTSVALQHGVPLETLVATFKGFWFLPFGEVHGDPRVSEATSILDYVFKELELTYIKNELPPAEPGLSEEESRRD